MAEKTKAKERRLVVCCDGTSNEIVGHITNVLKLYRIAKKDASQRVFYDAGIGSVSELPAYGRWAQKAKEFLGLATGFGLDDNILRAYCWLSENYQSNDKIYLFGFSRGAYTVRALAGLMNMIGLLTPDQLHLARYALTAYKRAAEGDDFQVAYQFRRLTDAVDAPIHFMGVWDTVASVLVPRPDRLYIPSLQFLPYTRTNERIRTFRHAIAIDERRAMFRAYGWTDKQKYREKRFGGRPVAQNAKQVWFAGVHADVGGGYPERESALAKYPLDWMLDEAVAAGLEISTSMRSHLVGGAKVAGGKQIYSKPDVAGPTHKSLVSLWWALEIFPKRTKYRRWPKRRGFLGLYLPLAEPRFIPDGSNIHWSAVARREMVKSYAPPNWPSTFVKEGTRPKQAKVTAPAAPGRAA